MYAIVRTGGKQYRVQPGDVVRVEKLARALGDEFDLDEVLLVGGEKTYVGQPVVDGAQVTVVVTRQARAPKLVIFKKKRRQGYRRMQGHRQWYTELFVKQIRSPEGEVRAADSKPHVYDPQKREEKLATRAAAAAAAKKEKSKEGVELVAKKAKKKKVAKKATVKKKAAGKRTKVGKKKAVKKAAATKTTKKKKS